MNYSAIFVVRGLWPDTVFLRSLLTVNGTLLTTGSPDVYTFGAGNFDPCYGTTYYSWSNIWPRGAAIALGDVGVLQVSQGTQWQPGVTVWGPYAQAMCTIVGASAALPPAPTISLAPEVRQWTDPVLGPRVALALRVRMAGVPATVHKVRCWYTVNDPPVNIAMAWPAPGVPPALTLAAFSNLYNYQP